MLGVPQRNVFEKSCPEQQSQKNKIATIEKKFIVTVKKKFAEFLEKWWPLPQVADPPTDEEIKAFKRAVWYCNYCEKAIPELQTFNANRQGKTCDYQADELLCSQYYQKDQKYQKYRVYRCGHAFLDISLICLVYDYVNFCWSSKPIVEEVWQKLDLANQCPCGQKNMSHHSQENRLSMYDMICKLHTGTIFLLNCLPKTYLELLADEYKEGDVVDVNGYRGTGLYLHTGFDQHGVGHWKAVPRVEYYPSWPLKYLKMKGYRHYLNQYDFDEVRFKNQISFWPNVEHFGKSSHDTFDLLKPFQYHSESEAESESGPNEYLDYPPENKEEYENITISDFIRPTESKLESGLEVYHHKQWLSLIKADSHWLLPYPFESARQVNAYHQSGYPLKAKISEFDYLVMEKEDCTDWKGNPIKTKNLFITDLTGNDKTYITY